MLYQEFKPIKPLQPFIKFIWIQEFDGIMKDPQRERILPDCCIEVVLHFGEPFKTYFTNNTSEVQPQSFIIAQMRNYIEIEPRGRIGMIGVRFYPWGIYHFLNYTIKEIRDRVMDLPSLWGKEGKTIEEQIYCASSNIERVKIVENYLLNRLRNDKEKFQLADYGLQYIYKFKGKVTTDQLIDHLGFSSKYVQRLFNSTIGVSPKYIIRLYRFLNACNYLGAGQFQTLADVAYEFGYYDQSHFIKEFKEFSGLTPKEFLGENNISYAEAK